MEKIKAGAAKLSHDSPVWELAKHLIYSFGADDRNKEMFFLDSGWLVEDLKENDDATARLQQCKQLAHCLDLECPGWRDFKVLYIWPK